MNRTFRNVSIIAIPVAAILSLGGCGLFSSDEPEFYDFVEEPNPAPFCDDPSATPWVNSEGGYDCVLPEDYAEKVAAANALIEAERAESRARLDAFLAEQPIVDEATKLGAVVRFYCTASKSGRDREVAKLLYRATWTPSITHMWPESFDAATEYTCATEPVPPPMDPPPHAPPPAP